MNNTRRVVITGIGAVTPIGTGKQALWEGVLRGKSAVRRISHFDPTQFSSQIAAEVTNFDPLDYMDAKKARRMDRFSQFAVAAGYMALVDSGLDLLKEDSEKIGSSIGSALGGVPNGEAQHLSFLEHGIRAVNPQLALTIYVGAGGCNLSMELGSNGPALSNANSCASGTVAIGEAFRLIQHGEADIVFAGGAEAPLSPLAFGAFTLLRALSRRNDDPATACRPFDRDRDGFVMAEGGAVLVLEELTHALRRDTPIYAELLGYALTTDAYHMTAPLPDGKQSARCITRSLNDAAITPAQLDYINAHASSTVLNDKTETIAIKRALGEHATRIPISGTKGLHGHALGATGAIEAAICAQIFHHCYLPPTANLFNPDPCCDLDYIPSLGREQHISTLLSNSFGFGGLNAALVMGRYKS